MTLELKKPILGHRFVKLVGRWGPAWDGTVQIKLPEVGYMTLPESFVTQAFCSKHGLYKCTPCEELGKEES